MRIADPLTHVPLASLPDAPFPILLVDKGVPRIVILDDGHNLPPLKAGQTYLVAQGEAERIEDQLQQRQPSRSGGWELRVEQQTADRQRIELYFVDDGYSGGAYDDTATRITPKYRKRTGPGFAFIASAVAFAMSAALWLPIAFYLRLRSRKRS